MSQSDLTNLESVPRFTVGEMIVINGVTFEIRHIAGRALQLLVADTQADKWRAFGQGVVEHLNENGLLIQR